ncbi:MAG TPA: TldD/PmbA family protein [candidate division Zixibacteria bacterium]|mgnify:CR=1 FL=1|nr:TldD/PmbA family protein [candidate division Zixibacteria bacterium]
MIDEHTLNQCLNILLSAGAEYADIFADRGRFYSSLSDDRKISTSAHEQTGVGIRAIKENADYYVVCESFNPNKLIETARRLASGLKLAGEPPSVSLKPGGIPEFYKPQRDPRTVPLTEKIAMLKEAEQYAWDFSDKIKQVTIHYSDLNREIMFASSEEQEILHKNLALIEFFIYVYAGRDGDERQLGRAGKSFYRGWEAFEGESSPKKMVKEACEQALLMLDARECPSGEMPVVFAPGGNGVLFHESCGHGMEADLVQKGSSFAGLMNKQVSSDKITIKDSGLIPGFPGSFSFDDEGIESQETTLIENGILRNYLHSRMTARQMNLSPTGSGRRQSYRYPPMPRMRNTFIEAGPDNPEEIIRGTRRGLYAADVGFGGQVDVVTGRFITSIILGYMIEDGKLTYPVKGATITGIGIETLKDIDMVGNDLVMDPSSGRCGKGQEVPVGVGMPTLRVKKLVVGGAGQAFEGQG